MNALIARDRPLPGRPVRTLRPSVRRQATTVRLWLPLTPLAILASPLALAVLPFAQVAFARRGLSPWRMIFGAGGVLMALSGTIIEVDSPAAQVRIHIF